MPGTKAQRIGPFSRPHVLLKIDGRTKEAKLLQRTRLDLLAHIGPTPSAVQLALVERAAWLGLRCALLDRKLSTETLPEADSDRCVAFSNAFIRCVARLGLESSAPRSPRQMSTEAIEAVLEQLTAGAAP